MQKDLGTSLALILLSSTWGLSLEDWGASRGWRPLGSQVSKEGRPVPEWASFWNWWWEMISWGRGPWGRVGLKTARPGVTSVCWPPSITALSPRVSRLLGGGWLLLSFLCSIREDDSDTALGHWWHPQIGPSPSQWGRRGGDRQAVPRHGPWEEGQGGSSLGPSDPTWL